MRAPQFGAGCASNSDAGDSLAVPVSSTSLHVCFVLVYGGFDARVPVCHMPLTRAWVVT